MLAHLSLKKFLFKNFPKGLILTTLTISNSIYALQYKLERSDHVMKPPSN